jgi:hypothetical protein
MVNAKRSRCWRRLSENLRQNTHGNLPDDPYAVFVWDSTLCCAASRSDGYAALGIVSLNGATNEASTA